MKATLDALPRCLGTGLRYQPLGALFHPSHFGADSLSEFDQVEVESGWGGRRKGRGGKRGKADRTETGEDGGYIICIFFTS